MIADDGTPRGRGRFSIVAPRIENGTVTGVRYGLENESAKLNINAVAQMEQQKAGTGKALLMALPGMDDPTSDAILDWLDTDSDTRENGAENDYYNNLTPPYNCKNGPIDSIEELAQSSRRHPRTCSSAAIRTATASSILGEEGRSQLAEGAGVDPEWDRGWAAYLTVYSKEANLMADGTPKININSNDLSTLSEDLNEIGFSQEWVNFIIAYRQFGPYTAPTSPSNQQGGGGGLAACGGNGGGRRRRCPIHAVSDKLALPRRPFHPSAGWTWQRCTGRRSRWRRSRSRRSAPSQQRRRPTWRSKRRWRPRWRAWCAGRSWRPRHGAADKRDAAVVAEDKAVSPAAVVAVAARAAPVVALAHGGGAAAQETTADQVTIDLTKPAKFQFTSVLDLVGAQVQFTPSSGGTGGGGGGAGGGGGSQPKAVILKTPFEDNGGLAGTYLPTLLDSVTITDAGSFPGRININQAPRALLLAIPGMTSDIVDSIVANRQPEFTGDQPDKKYETWIYTEGYCTLAQMKQFYPFITAGGCVYRAANRRLFRRRQRRLPRRSLHRCRPHHGRKHQPHHNFQRFNLLKQHFEH